MTRSRIIAVTALAAFIVGVFPFGSPASAHCGAVELKVRTFHVVAKWTKKSYKIGDMAKLKVNVTRPSKKDPVTEDGTDMPTESPYREPAADVTLGLAIFVGDVYLNGGGITGADGTATVKVPLPEYSDTGMADTRLYAYKRYFQSDDIIPSSISCVHFEEYGMLEPGPGVQITRSR
ncbi:MAG: hypothetical protein ACRDLB_15715 [Actinomycetota bacterium]